MGPYRRDERALQAVVVCQGQIGDFTIVYLDRPTPTSIKPRANLEGLAYFMEHRFTRKELYDQVWSKPISHLVSELGTTTGILSALLRRADIPTPPSGYWMRKEFGKPVVQMALPPAPAGCLEPLLLDTEARGVGRRPKPVEVMVAPRLDPVTEPRVQTRSNPEGEDCGECDGG